VRLGDERGELAYAVRVLLAEVGVSVLVRELEEAVAAATVPAHRGGEPTARGRMLGGLVAEALPGGVRLDLGLGQATGRRASDSRAALDSR
jgi:hypothetical protein